MGRNLPVALFTISLVVSACSRQPAAPPTTKTAAPSKSNNGAIGPEGGTFSGKGSLSVPAGAVKNEKTYSIQQIIDAESLAQWPNGAMAGYLLQPAGQHFRVPILIEIPHEQGAGDLMCQLVDGTPITVDNSPSDDHYHFEVAELPARCTVFSADHSAAVNAAKSRQGAVVAKQNEQHKWQIQNEMCNPNILARVNSGRSLQEPPGIEGCPPGMAPIPGKAVCVDRWEAHLVEVLEDGSTHSWSPYFNPGNLKMRARSTPNAVPQSYLSQIQATAACVEAGKRLCNDVEWVAACKGKKNTQYPYGNDEKLNACNDHRDRHPAIEYLESTDVFAKLEHPCINQVPNSVLFTGSKEECQTSEGVYDMVGNLHEWTADRNGTFRGGYYVEAKLNGRGCDYVTTRHDAIYWDYSIGFRCCADKK